jgi:class 3 adenylate cyclase/tetratricopeptide (TPR) repeat protein
VNGAPAADNPGVAEGRAPGGYLTGLHARWLAERPDQRHQGIEGTLVFADVSGFTVLGERLARQGRVGAEILSDTVNTVFAGMLDVVTLEGGEILKFGGDAILALFTGDGHEARGASAGLGLQAMLRALRRERAVNLRLSAGVASGRVDLFLAGASPRELIVAGPLASEVLTLEAAAEAGQVLVSPATAAALPARCVRDSRLRAAPAVAPSAPVTMPDHDPRPGLPLHLHDHVPGDPEHRSVTVAFVQFKGTDRLLAEQGPDALARALDDVVGAAADAALSHGVTFVGTDVDKDAGKVILVAGAPTASPDDDDRMLHALRAVVGTRRSLAVRAGVNRGRVFTVDIGPAQRRTWTVMGDDVNLAARVMGRAEPGTVLATQSVLARLRDDFRRKPVEPFHVKGKTAAVIAEEIGEARDARRAQTGVAPLVGRELELAELREALDEARSGAHRVIELVGEPGIGKSRLMEAVIAAVGDLPSILVQGGPYAAHSPYRAVRAPLRALLGLRADARAARVADALRAAVGPDAEPWLPLIAIPFGIDLPPTPQSGALSPEFARARLVDHVRRLVDTLLPAGPAALLVEDAHWLDEGSQDLLAALAAADRPGGRFVVSTRRDVAEGLHLGDCRQMRLGPISEAAARSLMTEEATLLPGDEAKIVSRAAGNPLLLQELLAAARAGASVDDLPDTVEALVTARMDTLPRADRRLLREASVLGIHVPVDLLGRMLDADAFAVEAALARLDDFLVAGGPRTTRFRHGLLRDAAYETLPFRRRRELHARAARLVEADAGPEADDQAELLALHFHAARDWEPAWRYARLAADQALRRAAPTEAAGFLGQALEAGRALAEVSNEQLAGVAEQLGDAAELGGRFERAAAAYAEARARRRGDALAEAGLCFKEGRLRDKTQTVAQSLRWYTRGLRSLDRAPAGAETTRLRARLELAHGATRLRAGRLRECLPFLERALHHARAGDDRHTIAHAYFLLEAAHADLGTSDAPYSGLALPIFEELGDDWGCARALNNMGINAFYQGRWDEAADLYARAAQASGRIGDVIEATIAEHNIAEIRSDQGRYHEATAMLQEALHTWRGAGFALGVGLASSNLGRVAARRGDLDEAETLLSRARAQLRELGSEQLVLDVDVREAERRLFGGDHASALALAGTARLTVQRLGGMPVLMATLQRIAGFAKLQAGLEDEARVRFRESVGIARSVGFAFEEALSLEGLALAGGDNEAGSAAAEIFARLGVVASPAVPLPR